MNNKVLSLIRKVYCEDRGIVDVESVTLTYYNKDLATGEHLFTVDRKGEDSVLYRHLRADLGGLSKFKTLSIPSKDRHGVNGPNNKEIIANWVFSKTGHVLLDEDIQFLVVERDHVTVMLHPDSMRFKNDFQLIRL